jgi:hypothetical protein
MVVVAMRDLALVTVFGVFSAHWQQYCSRFQRFPLPDHNQPYDLAQALATLVICDHPMTIVDVLDADYVDAAPSGPTVLSYMACAMANGMSTLEPIRRMAEGIMLHVLLSRQELCVTMPPVFGALIPCERLSSDDILFALGSRIHSSPVECLHGNNRVIEWWRCTDTCRTAG